MQQPQTHSDGQPQQSTIQFSNQQQMPPQMMLCPVQFVYDPQVLVPPDEHVQQPQPVQQSQAMPTPSVPHQTYIINVQNTPPWIQNRPNMVYMPQVVNNMPYLHQNMVQNPMINYQYQPMLIQQDIRQLPMQMQNQNMINQSILQQQNMLQKQQILQNQQNQTKLLQAQQMNQQRMMQNTQNLVQNQMLPTQIVQSPQRINAQTLVQNQQKLLQNQNIIQNQQEQQMLNQGLVQAQVPTQVVRQRAPQQMQNQRMVMTQIPQSISNTQPRPKSMPVLAQMLQPKQQTGNQTDNQMITIISKPVNPNDMATLRPQYPQMMERQVPQMIALNSIANLSHNTPNTIPINNSTLNNPNNVSNNIPGQTTAQNNHIHHTNQPNDNQSDTTVPQHIRNQIPEGLSVKTVFKAPMTATVRPTPPDDPRTSKPVMRNSTTNTETSYKRKIRDMIEQKEEAQAKRARVDTKINEVQARPEAVHARLELPQVRHEVNQNEEKMLRNTVFIQARGRINDVAESSRINPGINSMESDQRPNEETITANTINLGYTTQVSQENIINSIQENRNNVNMHTSIDNAIENVVRLTGHVPVSHNETPKATVSNHQMPAEPGNQMTEDDRTLNEIKITLESMKRAKLLSEEDTRMKELENRAKDNAVQNKKKQPEKESNSNKTKTEKVSLGHTNKKQSEKETILSKKSLTEKDNTAQSNKKIEKELVSTKNVTEKENTIQNNKNEFEKENNIQNKRDMNSLEDFKRKLRRSDEKKAETKPKISMKDRVEKFVLTHVLDGHIIQESNEPFMVKKPTLPFQRKQNDNHCKQEIKSPVDDIKIKTDVIAVKAETAVLKPPKEESPEKKSKNEESSTSPKIKTEKSNPKANENETGGPSKRGRPILNKESKRDKESSKKEKEVINTELSKANERDRESKRITEREDRLLTDNDKSKRREAETAVKKERKEEESQVTVVKIEVEEVIEDSQTDNQSEDNPFKNISIETLKSWSMSDLYDHLAKHDWLETAQKLQEEEIDGESLLLVNIDQLIQIGICETHAAALSAFIETEQSE